jgi:hypothetical protein
MQVLIMNVKSQIVLNDSIKSEFVQEEIKRSLNYGNTCYHSVQNLFSFCLLSKNLEIAI